jgi:hypothetical protein
MAFVVLHVSVPYKSTYFTFELKIFIFVLLAMIPGVGTHRVRIERAGTQLELGRKTSAKSS